MHNERNIQLTLKHNSFVASAAASLVKSLGPFKRFCVSVTVHATVDDADDEEHMCGGASSLHSVCVSMCVCVCSMLVCINKRIFSKFN